MRDIGKLLFELNWFTVRFGWKKLVVDKTELFTCGYTRTVWEHLKTQEVREERA